MAVPLAGRDSISSYLARAIPASESKNSRCTGATLVTTPISGCAIFAKRANLAGVRHAHLDDGDVVLGFQLQQHKRQAEMIVEVAFGLQHAVARG